MATTTHQHGVVRDAKGGTSQPSKPAGICRLLTAGASAILLGNIVGAFEAGATDFDIVGTLPNGSASTFANGVSSDGNVVIGSSAGQAFLWTSDGGAVGLGFLPGGMLPASFAFGASANGSVVVGDTLSQAFRWTKAGGIVGLGYLPGDSYSTASGVSADGSVVVGTSLNSTLTSLQAYRWTQADGMVGLGFLPGHTLSGATGVSADGSVVVGASASSAGYGTEAFRWTQAGGMVGLGFLPGYTFSIANAISGNGAVVVGNSSAPQGTQAFRWTQSVGMVGLGFLPGPPNSSAAAVSSDGSVVVGSSGIGISSQAFRWTQASGMQSVVAWLASRGITVNGWNLTEATGVSGNGSVIVGNGSNAPGRNEAWIARDTGLIGLADIASSLSTVSGALEQGTVLANSALHGAHGHPGEARVVSGKFCSWAAGDWAHSDRYNRDSGLAEAGLCGQPLGDDLEVGIGAGETWGWQRLAFDGSMNSQGHYVIADADARLGETPLWATVTGLFGWTGNSIRRGYMNAGNPDSSTGKPDVRTTALRLRLEARSLWHSESAEISPYIDGTVLHSSADAYRETGGGFPSEFDRQSQTVHDLRIGTNAAYTVTDGTRLLGGVEAVHRFEGHGAGLSGDMIGLFGFTLPGARYQPDWLRASAGIEQRLGPGFLSASFTIATRGEDSGRLVAASYRILW